MAGDLNREGTRAGTEIDRPRPRIEQFDQLLGDQMFQANRIVEQHRSSGSKRSGVTCAKTTAVAVMVLMMYGSL